MRIDADNDASTPGLILKGKCHRCGEGSLMRSWFRVNSHCPKCGQSFPVGEGAFLGSMAINYGIVVFGALPIGLLLASLFQIGWQGLLAGAVVLAAVVPPLIYPLSWRLWIWLGVTVLKDEDPEAH